MLKPKTHILTATASLPQRGSLIFRFFLDPSVAMILSLLISSIILFGSPVAFADSKPKAPLRGSVSEAEYLRRTGPSLSRTDINRAGDPFSSNFPEDVVKAPESMFNVNSIKPPPPPTRTFPLRADKEGDNFEGVPMDGLPDSNMMGEQPLAHVPMGPPPGLVDPNDPDSSRDMQLAWDLWHRRVAEEIYKRFNVMSQFAFKYSRPLAAKVNYTVTRDHRIVNTQLTQRSSNVAFNAMLLLVVNSLSSNPILEFPAGSRRMSVEKGGVFTQNFGQEGFRFTTGDRETIKLRH